MKAFVTILTLFVFASSYGQWPGVAHEKVKVAEDTSFSVKVIQKNAWYYTPSSTGYYYYQSKTHFNGDAFSSAITTSKLLFKGVNDSLLAKLADLGATSGLTINSAQNTIICSAADEDSIQHLYISRLKNEWTSFVRLGLVSDSINAIHPCFSKDGTHLLLSCNAPGYGGYDLFQSILVNDSTWSVPINLGETVNSSADEIYPSYSSNQLIHYSSNKKAPFQGFNGYSVEKKADEWTKQTLLGAPINSDANTFSVYKMNNESFIITSDHTGKSVIYQLKKGAAKPAIKGQLMLNRGYAAIKTMIGLFDKNDQLLEKTTTDQEGKFAFMNGSDQQQIIIKTIDDTKLSSNAKLYMLNESDQRVQAISLGEDGAFSFEYLAPDEYNKMPELVEEDASLLSIDLEGFIFNEIKGDIDSATAISIVNENDEVLYQVETDSTGAFNFQNIDPDANYTFKLNGSDDAQFLTILDGEGKEATTIKNEGGHFNYQRLPHDIHTMAVVAEENPEEMIDIFGTVYNQKEGDIHDKGKMYIIEKGGGILFSADIDEMGHFDFRHLPTTESLIFQMYGENTPFHLLITDENGNAIENLSPNQKGQFEFKELSSVKHYLNMFQEDHDNPDELIDLFGQAYITNPGDIPEGDEMQLLDEKGSVIQVSKIGKDGFFAFEDLAKVSNYSFSFAKTHADARVLLMNSHKEVIAIGNGGETAKFNFQFLEAEHEYLSLVDEQDAILHLIPDEIFTLKNIFYETNRHDVNALSAKQLDKVVSIIRKNPSLHAVITSHTDTRGSSAANLNLSQKRAKSAVNYLISKGVMADTISAVGKGEANPKVKCINESDCKESDHAKNRRTEIRFTLSDN